MRLWKQMTSTGWAGKECVDEHVTIEKSLIVSRKKIRANERLATRLPENKSKYVWQ